MCYQLYLASPLTLSEVRAMLPEGLSAGLLPAVFRDRLAALAPAVRDAVAIAHGGCACDLVGQRLPVPADDERRLRVRYRTLGLSRPAIISALELHRRTPGRGGPALSDQTTSWPSAFAGFVAEHARNSGPALYYLHFAGAAEPPALVVKGMDTRQVSVAAVRASPGAWLAEGIPTLVIP